MKPGNLVYFSNKYLPYDYAQLQGQYGLLLERVDIPTSNNDKFVKGWRSLWGEKIIFIYEKDLTVVETNTI